MSAQRLRDAAKVLRERAEDATPGPWAATACGDLNFNPSDLRIGWTVHFSRPANAAYIATMHPGVALALARLLDNAAEDFEMQGPGGELRDHWDVRVHTSCDLALTIADLIRGTPS